MFWLCVCTGLYPLAGYPLILLTLAKWRGRPVRRTACAPSTVSIILAAHNEEATIGRRVRELADLVRSPGLAGEVVVVSDGSTDRTVEIARSFAGDIVRVIELPQNHGKAAALNVGYAAARHELLVFADARQTWAPDALERLLENFSDPAIGAVSGDLVVEAEPGVMAGVGLYWRFEKWLRAKEGCVHSTVGVTGAISAVRRELFRPIPQGTILDDVYWPLRVAMQGFRVVHNNQARAFDQLPSFARDEFRRKVRTLSGNYQLVALLPQSVLPSKNPIWWQVLSHKISRLLMPWALLGVLATSVILPGMIYRVALGSQIACYLIGLAGLRNSIGSRSRLASAAASFLVLNVASWLAFWVWLTGRAAQTWGKIAYEETLSRTPAGDSIAKEPTSHVSCTASEPLT
jgi:cellulose synthase/poly-beta-1,6-N-acetylglucosamine synthase-like glycosyltransferase